MAKVIAWGPFLRGLGSGFAVLEQPEAEWEPACVEGAMRILLGVQYDRPACLRAWLSEQDRAWDFGSSESLQAQAVPNQTLHLKPATDKLASATPKKTREYSTTRIDHGKANYATV